MSLMELLFVTTALGVGAGVALALSKQYGATGGILGFIGGVAFVFLVLVLVIAMAKKKHSKVNEHITTNGNQPSPGTLPHDPAGRSDVQG